MQALRQVGIGFIFALISSGLVLGSLSTGLAEGYISQPRPTITETSIPASEPLLPSSTQTPADLSLLPPPTIPPSPTSTQPAPTNCPPPSGWLQYSVLVGDTLASLAQQYNTTNTNLLAANCLQTEVLIPNTFIYVPPFPTQTIIPCSPAPGWITYIVQRGDNLYRLSLAYRVSVFDLQKGNCLDTVNINAGQRLYVPNVPTSTPAITSTSTLTLTPATTFTPSKTPTLPGLVALTPANTNLPPSMTPTWTEPTPTDTSVPSFTSTTSP